MSGLESFGVWRLALSLVKTIYGVTARFPKDERFGLTAQLRRAAVSVPSNIAEGRAREGSREYAHFVSNAQGSLAEVLTQLHIAVELGYAKKDEMTDLFDQVDQIARKLNKTRRTLQTRTQPKPESRIPNPQSPIPNPESRVRNE